MALVVKDRVRETSTTTGTGTFTLAGAVTGYQAFSAVGDGNTTYYTIYLQGGNEWEVGIGTYTASGTTLSRDTILASSNAGSAVNFSAGTKDVFVTYPAGRSVWYDSATNVTLNALTLSGGTQNGVLYLNASRVATSGSALTFDGTNFATTGSGTVKNLLLTAGTLPGAGNPSISLRSSDNVVYYQSGSANTIVMLDSAQNTMQSIGATAQIWNISNAEQMRLTSTGLILRQSGAPANTSVSLNTTIQNALTLEADGDLLVGTTTNTNSSKLVASGTISETVSSTQYLVASQFDIGTAANEIPLNQYLGNLAYQDAGSIAGPVGLGGAVTLYSGTANGVLYLNGSKVLTSGSALTFNGSDVFGVSGAGTIYASVTNTTSGSGSARLKLFNSGDTSDGFALINNAGASGQVNILNYKNSAMGFWTNSIERMLLDSSGNLGLGVTPSAWSSSFKALNIGVNGQSVSADGGQIIIGSNYVQESGGARYVVSAAAGSYAIVRNSHSWYIAPSGTANSTTIVSGNQYTIVTAGGNFTAFGAANNNVGTVFTATSSGTASGGGATQTIVFTQAMTLDASGALNVAGATNVPTINLSDTLGDVKAQFLCRNSTTGNVEVTNTKSFALVFGTSNTERARITSTGGFETRPAANGHAVFNEDSVDADFRVESDSSTHAFFIDAGQNRIGMGVSIVHGGLMVQNYASTFKEDYPWMQPAGRVYITTEGGNNGVDHWWGISGGYGTSSGSTNILLQQNFGDFSSQGGHYIGSEAVGTGTADLSIGKIVCASSLNVNATKLEQIRLESGGGIITKPAANGHAVFNENGVDADFRVESDTDTHCLFVDASANNVGIGTNAPEAKLDVVKAGNSAGGTIMMSGSKTNNSIKYGNLTGAHYNNSTYPQGICGVGILSTSDDNFVDIGGNVGEQIAANTIRFWTAANTTTASGTERARITSGGYFKASNNGTYNGAANLYHEFYNTASDEFDVWCQHASATAPKGIRLYYSAAAPNGTGNHFLYCDDTGGQRASIRSNGGLANYQSNNVDLSDIRTKTDISPVASYWSKIAALEIVSYKYKDQTHDDLNIGVIAQQVEQVAPEFVDADGFGETPEDGVPLKTIYNKDLTFAAIKALQEAMARIEKLEAEVAALKGA